MTKKEFLKKLEEKLSILTEEERKDILSEYENTIDEKIKNGKKEKDAVKDFGDLEELTKDILEAYKINANYDKNSFENGIKDLANKLANWIKNIINKFKKKNEPLT